MITDTYKRMKIALIGYGKMGHIIERVAIERGHEVVCTIDKDNLQDFRSDSFRQADVAIEFTTPQTAVENIRKAWEAGLPIVCGTTGWQAELPALQEELRHNRKALFWSSNYSLGVNLFFLLNRRLAEIMQPYPQYTPAIKEIHHIHKLDAPSGTAVSLAQAIGFPTNQIESVREGEVPGTHIVRYESEADCIEIRHEAKSREGFALGAVLAAEFIVGKQGYYTMQDLLFKEDIRS